MSTDNIVTNHLVEMTPTMAEIEATQTKVSEQGPPTSEESLNPTRTTDTSMPMAVWNGS